MEYKINFFEGKKVSIATMHGKEGVIAPLLEKQLGVQCEVVVGLDTDLLGTFSGEIPRSGSALETARKKAQIGMEMAGTDLGLASEGSFGAHPSIPFVPANEELVLLLDRKNGWEFSGRVLSMETNYRQEEIESKEGLEAFCDAVGFPSHGVIMRVSGASGGYLFKELNSKIALLEQFELAKAESQKVSLETDMRAMKNPSRMKVIQLATQKLIDNLAMHCPSCGLPGFVATEWKQGLPCGLCGFKTKSILATSSTCQGCGFQEEKLFPQGKTEEDPQYCDFCNP